MSSHSSGVSSSESAESRRNELILNQLRALADISYNLLKSIEKDEDSDSDDSDSDSDDEDSLEKKKNKKSVMLPRIGRRSPVVFPRIGVQKKSAIFQPRIGRNSPSVDDDLFVDDKRAIVYQPRIGRK